MLERAGVTKRARVVEVYPALALHRWGFASRGYKGPKRAKTRKTLTDALLREADWLSVSSSQRELLDRSDDALVSALVARAAAMDLVDAIPEDAHSAPETEGWIVIPKTDSLPRLPAR